MYVVYEQCCWYSGDANGDRRNCYLRMSSPLSICASLEINLYSSNFYHFPYALDFFEINTHARVILQMLALADISSIAAKCM